MNNNIFIRPPQIGPAAPLTPQKTPVQHSNGPDFQSIFQQAIAQQKEVKFSAHALKRLESRQIKLSPEDMVRLTEAVDRAEAKGARESLILIDQLALIVSIKNRTVITAVDGQSLKENVFTNIDSAVIAR